MEHARGERHGSARLTEAQVREIRASSDSSYRLAQVYDVVPQTIRAIRARKTWRHVP